MLPLSLLLTHLGENGPARRALLETALSRADQLTGADYDLLAHEVGAGKHQPDPGTDTGPGSSGWLIHALARHHDPQLRAIAAAAPATPANLLADLVCDPTVCGPALSYAPPAHRVPTLLEKIGCSAVDVAVDTSDFNKQPGITGSVNVTVSCRLDLSDLAIPGVPGSRVMRATMSSPLDTWRER
ncbi:hypothetical protein [Nocardioides marmotae]|uniref:hypothetical protein n=1 Tax=Nocardioides marmotae TaxID=2663857 RepID=UPI0012B64617|nr:hypothetical protein [Nocardioides marmotae]MBC9733844.1 hypothetical protein [Nocardioides marmotae]MTB84946.1 hypothetical protein [Nocardioides marmotae]